MSELLFDAKATANAIWSYVTSVKSLRRRDGRVDHFDPLKLERSIRAALVSADWPDADQALARTITQTVIDRLTKVFDGHTVPSSEHLHDIVSVTLMDYDLQDVAKHYCGFRTKIHMLGAIVSKAASTATAEVPTPRRRRMTDERQSITHKFEIGDHTGYLTVGLYDDGKPGEIFISMSKEGSTISGLMDALAMSVSIGLQYGVPLKTLVEKFAHVRFEPSGFTSNPNIRMAKSLIDYVFRWLAIKFLTPDEQHALGINALDNGLPESALCKTCGSMAYRKGEEIACEGCGAIA